MLPWLKAGRVPETDIVLPITVAVTSVGKAEVSRLIVPVAVPLAVESAFRLPSLIDTVDGVRINVGITACQLAVTTTALFGISKVAAVGLVGFVMVTPGEVEVQFTKSKPGFVPALRVTVVPCVAVLGLAL